MSYLGGWRMRETLAINLPFGDDGYPLVNIQKAIENGHRNSGFSHTKW